MSSASGLRVALDVSGAMRAEPTGVAHYIRRLTAGLAEVAAASDRFVLCHRISAWKERAHRPTPPDGRFARRWFQGRVGPRGLDVVHGPDGRVLSLGRAARVVTVHDVFALEPGAEGRASWIERMRRRYAEVAARADLVICLSAWTRGRFLHHHPTFDDSRIHVIQPGVETIFAPEAVDRLPALRRRLGLDEDAPYVLFLGALVERKNPDGLIRAWTHLPRDAPRLVFAGAELGRGTHLREAAARAGVGPRVDFVSHLDAADVPSLLAGAACLVLPSRAEGFGLPVLEAQACGTPVVHSGRAALPEATGGVGVEVDPDDPEAIAAGVRRLLEDEALAARLRAEGLARAARFDWRETARRTLGVYSEAASASSPSPSGS